MKIRYILLIIHLLFIFINTLNGAELSAYHQKSQDPGKIVILIDNEIFTSYRFGPNQKYPYFYPVNGPKSLLRMFP